jgi:hypothetical protein
VTSGSNGWAWASSWRFTFSTPGFFICSSSQPWASGDSRRMTSSLSRALQCSWEHLKTPITPNGRITVEVVPSVQSVCMEALGQSTTALPFVPLFA